MPDATSAVRDVYKPRRPQASPLFRLVSDRLHRLQTVYDDRFAREYGSWRPVVAFITQASVNDQILAHLRTRALHTPRITPRTRPTPARGVPPRPGDQQGPVPPRDPQEGRRARRRPSGYARAVDDRVRILGQPRSVFLSRMIQTTTTTASQYRFAGRAAIGSGSIGILSFAVLMAAVTTRTTNALSIHGPVYIMFKAHDVGCILKFF